MRTIHNIPPLLSLTAIFHDIDIVTGVAILYYAMPLHYITSVIFTITITITLSRDDVVVALLQRGALVKIVNNKGQTPVSLAASHLLETTIGDTLSTRPTNTPYQHSPYQHSQHTLSPRSYIQPYLSRLNTLLYSPSTHTHPINTPIPILSTLSCTPYQVSTLKPLH